MATQTLMMLEILLENRERWNAEQRLRHERMSAERGRMEGEQDPSAAECTNRTERSTLGPRHNI